jgi:DNA polymerase-3 subunit delta'
MLHGPEGCGKLPLALAYAQYMNCTSRTETDACGTCPSCLKYNKLVHPDLHFSYPATTTNDATAEDVIDKWREAVLENPWLNVNQWFEKIGMENKQGIIGVKDSLSIIRKLSLKSYEADYKVLIMWLPERMNRQSANKLLKLIEEPPPGTVFLLVSEAPDEVLPTIQSRTQMIRIPKMPEKDIMEALVSAYGIAQTDARDAARISGGNFNMALAAANADETLKDNFEKFVALMRFCYKKSIRDLMAWTDEIAGKGREGQKLFLSYALRMIRENLMLNMERKEISFMTGFEEEFSVKFSRFIHSRNAPALYEELNLAYLHISANGSAKIVFMDLSLKIMKLLQL